MSGLGINRAFLAGIIGGILGALLFATVPAVTAAVGDAISLGEVTTGNAVTTVRGSSEATLRLVNQQAGRPALDLRVTGGSPPFQVDSSRKVARLNADKVDGRSANQFARVASAYISNPPDQDGPAATTTIIAPTDGFLVMAGSVGVAGLALDSLRCSFAVQGGSGTRFYGHQDVLVDHAGGDHTNNSRDICSISAASEVPAGTYEVSLEIAFRNSANLDRANIWVLFVPFDGTGAVPAPDPW
jgi:hypothetical protein